MIRCLIFICLIIALILFIFSLTKDYYNNSPKNAPNFKGLCLFDIDGTLTTGQDNAQSIDICLKNGYAVGISTAGAMYTPENLLSFPWMPHNLYYFMKKYNWVTFNNVARSIYAGKYQPQPNYNNFGHKKWGILKAHSLLESSKHIGMGVHSKLVLFDNDPGFLEGLNYFPRCRGICSGQPCSKYIILNPALVQNSLNKLELPNI